MNVLRQTVIYVISLAYVFSAEFEITANPNPSPEQKKAAVDISLRYKYIGQPQNKS
ncbi:hypothetical protein NEPAR06_0001 [Nematocida parisii]|uniref:Uncharacterized protein n=1 Tax=Nematocida parisii (strain ERTm3) TaxID=935791 RepID=I3EDY7_NEMP3|nr:uncharacterized protein NEPG_00036 [Nematocida parisii ERTm1]EIJ87434.1 hypothetical protein NEQG_02315 [Nematocida parisii ERTm3]KAI5127052.1 hypothetical protein NEPAR08_0724 [Nematocida parisii]EIJ94514.1 hypothetical protein NEPG_00036 [Nematocida parisii ERTm1]KAI5127604.1 hypothetical protein NEPAR03_0994 [Nematocida parisii]KAI5141151.1 hypothetical protein NEPAR04_0722 [Nematocida parisii]|eukprot:XP_013057870.1 hypothetical protein NEPG_00036 [Nematocida parisii ERTm1]